MKQKSMFILILLFAVNAFAQQAGSQLVGEITELIGTVELKPAGQTGFIPAKAGDTVAPDTIVSTWFKSTALIRVGSTVLAVRPLTRLSFSEISSSTNVETINVNLHAGRVRADVKPPSGTRGAITIQSPMATASVRGTSFEFDTQNLTVLEGTVAFRGREGGIMLINAGQTSDINQYGRSIDPMAAFTVELFPLPPAGSDTGFINSGTSGPVVLDSIAEFGLGFQLK